MKVLLLGHTGFVGQNMMEKLDQASVPYVGVSRKVNVDLRSFKQLLEVLECESFDIIINCVAHVGSLNYVSEKAGEIIDDNIKMISAMYEATRVLDRDILIVNPIANCSYPGDLNFYTESDWQSGAVHPSVASYGNTRRMLVAYAEAYEKQYGIRSINLLVPNMYGPFDSTDPNKAHALYALVAKFVKAEKNASRLVQIWGTGTPVREWLYAADFADLVFQVITRPELQKKIQSLVNMGQNRGFSIREIASTINECFGQSIKSEYLTDMPDGAPKKVMDDKLFRSIFGKYEFTSLRKGVRNTVEYYVSQYPY